MRQRLLRVSSSMAQTVVAVMIGVLLTIGVLLVISDDPTLPDILEREEQILDNQQTMMCLLLYPAAERTPEVLVACQTPVDP